MCSQNFTTQFNLNNNLFRNTEVFIIWTKLVVTFRANRSIVILYFFCCVIIWVHFSELKERQQEEMRRDMSNSSILSKVVHFCPHPTPRTDLGDVPVYTSTLFHLSCKLGLLNPQQVWWSIHPQIPLLTIAPLEHLWFYHWVSGNS